MENPYKQCLLFKHNIISQWLLFKSLCSLFLVKLKMNLTLSATKEKCRERTLLRLELFMVGVTNTTSIMISFVNCE